MMEKSQVRVQLTYSVSMDLLSNSQGDGDSMLPFALVSLLVSASSLLWRLTD